MRWIKVGKKVEGWVEIVSKGKPIFGSLSSAYLPCGNPRCTCAKGQLHGPAWRLTWKEPGGKRHILYVPKSRLEEVKKMADQYREARGILAEIGLYNLSLLTQELKKK